jgi:hypothetical protein
MVSRQATEVHTVTLSLSVSLSYPRSLEEIGKERIAEMSAMDFLTMLSTSKVTCFETIRKLRQQVQAKNESLRGDEYGKRKKKVLSNFLLFKRD